MEKHEFKPKDWVLVRDDDDERWKLDIFSHVVDGLSFPYACISGHYVECVAYEGSESLLGTYDKPVEWKVGDEVEVQDADDGKWYDGEIVKINTERDEGFVYYVEASCFCPHNARWCRANQLRKPKGKSEWRPKEGEFVEVLREGEWKSGKVLEDDHSSVPFYVRIEDGETRWFTECKVRPAKKKEKDEPFKFGDKVQCREDREWMDGLFIMDDHTTIRYLVYLPEENDTIWLREEDVRRA